MDQAILNESFSFIPDMEANLKSPSNLTPGIQAPSADSRSSESPRW